MRQESNHDRERNERRHTLAPSVLPLYADGKGHKTIAKELGISPRLTRTILIESGVYQPGKLHSGERHRALVGEATRARVPAWKREGQRREEERKKGRVHKFSDLDLFKAANEQKKRDSLPEQAKEYRERYATDIPFRITEILRRRLQKVAKRGRGYSGNHLEWLGCTPVELQAHLAAQFTEGMTWGNAGAGQGKWHIDHVRPCASFNMENEAERLACFHYSNLRPMCSGKGGGTVA
jgi:hypothetical protein